MRSTNNEPLRQLFCVKIIPEDDARAVLSCPRRGWFLQDPPAALVRRPMRLRLNTLLLLVLLLGALAAAPAPAGTGMFVGAAEDDGRNLDPLLAKSKLDLAAIAGLGPSA